MKGTGDQEEGDVTPARYRKIWGRGVKRAAFLREKSRLAEAGKKKRRA